MPSYYFDTNALYPYYRPAEVTPRLHRMVSDADRVFITPITYLEYFNVVMKYFRKGELKRRDINTLIGRLTRDTTADEATPRIFVMQPIADTAFARAQDLLLRYGKYSFGSLDALHIAIAEQLRVSYADLQMVSSDKGVKNVCQAIQLACVDPELEQP